MNDTRVPTSMKVLFTFVSNRDALDKVFKALVNFFKILDSFLYHNFSHSWSHSFCAWCTMKCADARSCIRLMRWYGLLQVIDVVMSKPGWVTRRNLLVLVRVLIVSLFIFFDNVVFLMKYVLLVESSNPVLLQLTSLTSVVLFFVFVFGFVLGLYDKMANPSSFMFLDFLQYALDITASLGTVSPVSLDRLCNAGLFLVSALIGISLHWNRSKQTVRNTELMFTKSIKKRKKKKKKKTF